MLPPLITHTNLQEFHTFTLFLFLLSSTLSLVGYQISYRLDSRDPQRWTTVEVGSNARQFTVSGLTSEQTYIFRLTARTAVGWGEEQEALVVTTERRGTRCTQTNEHYTEPPWLPCVLCEADNNMRPKKGLTHYDR